MNADKMCLSAAEVSEQTGISLSLIRKLTRCGEIPHLKVGRRILYPTEALTNWLTQNTTGYNVPDKGGGSNG